MKNMPDSTLSAADRVSLSREEQNDLVRRMHEGDAEARRLLTQFLQQMAAGAARRMARPPLSAGELYLVGEAIIADFLDRYHGGDTMGVSHAFSWPLRQALMRAIANYHSYH